MLIHCCACRLVAAGVTVVTAAGNQNEPACDAQSNASSLAITVGASDEVDTRLLLTDGEGSDYGPCVDIYAPGSNVPGASAASNDGGAVHTGTSQAAALVAGAAALVLQQWPQATPGEVRQALMSASAGSAVRTKADEGPAWAPLLQVAHVTGTPALATQPASLVLEATSLQPQLELQFVIVLGARAKHNVELDITDSSAQQAFAKSSVVIHAGESRVPVTMQPDAKRLMATASNRPFKLRVEASSKDRTVDNRSVPVVVRWLPLS